ncbi:hypothetical protein F2P81_023936 [Scophthalmus maximus]|uniref:Uncharacterized protein n=1 Tax=Scophthalmus maximus TaxID=52904 RepID=A0A6A4RLE8_SCOMX|nr:hypothetical protein F2P81_023936 [Scophthalmus maximus]
MFNAADRALDTAAFNYTNAAMQFSIASGIFNVRAILTTDLTTRTAALTTGVRSVLAGALTLASSAAVAELGRSERNRGRWIVFFVCTSTPFSRWEVIIQVLSESHVSEKGRRSPAERNISPIKAARGSCNRDGCQDRLPST